MDEFDIVVVGGGSGSQVASAAAEAGLEAAVVERGPLGGACITRGCVPSKALIHRADLLEEIRRVDRFGIDAEVRDLEYGRVRDEIRDAVFQKAARHERQLEDAEGIALHEGEARFVDERTLAIDGVDSNGDDESNGRRIRGEQIVIAVGGRPATPPIDGLDEVDALTSTEALWLDEPPGELVVIGGGYVGVELAHFFAAVGTDVSIVGRSDRLLPGEDEVASERVTAAMERRCDLYTGYEAASVDGSGGTVGGADGDVTVTAEPAGGDESSSDQTDGESIELSADELLVAAGRRPNTDTLDLEAAGVETDDAGHVVVDDSLETSVDGVWALGDVLAEQPFKHAADYEARLVSRNALADAGVSLAEGAETGDGSGREAGSGPDRGTGGESDREAGGESDREAGGESDREGDGESDREAVDYAGMPHAVFAEPRVASLGKTEAELDDEGVAYESAAVDFTAAPLGMIRKESGNVAKVLAAPDGEILGCHVVGSEAETMIHEVVVAIRSGSGTVDDVAAGIHVHPTMPEVLQKAFVELSDDPYVTAPDWRETAGGE